MMGMGSSSARADPAIGAPVNLDGFALGELVRRTGVAASTVHLYRRLGLLPPAGTSSRNRSVYSLEHVRHLRAIRRLRERNHLSLDAVARVLPDVLTADLDTLDDDGWDAAIADLVHLAAPGRPPARLLRAARDAFARHGYEGASVEDICSTAKLAKGSFYRYFSSKEDAFVAAARSIVDVVDDAVRDRTDVVTMDEAIEEVGELLDPWVPLFLEVVLRALHGQEGHGGVVEEVMAGVGAIAGRRAGWSAERIEERGSDLAEIALARLVRAHFELPVLDTVETEE
jgi:AcrR family transcriptional regulator/DNA-binding transcriptional MerR regulator